MSPKWEVMTLAAYSRKDIAPQTLCSFSCEPAHSLDHGGLDHCVTAEAVTRNVDFAPETLKCLYGSLRQMGSDPSSWEADRYCTSSQVRDRRLITLASSAALALRSLNNSRASFDGI
jgi:hypothetical protein